MQIVRDGHRRGLVHLQEVGDDAFERSHRLRRLQVADVLADEDLPAHAQRHGVFQVRAYGQDCRDFIAQKHRERRIAARPAQQPGHAAHDPGHTVVDVAGDGTVVHQESIGDVAESLEGILFVRADRLIRQIAAGGDHGKAQLAQQQVMQWGVGQHHAQVGVAGRDLFGDFALRILPFPISASAEQSAPPQR